MATLTQAFNSAKDKDDTITADQLTDLVNDQTGRDLSAKTIRAELRKMKVRDQAKFKNARYRIDKTVTEKVVKRFTKTSEPDEAQAS